ncbi:MAG: hypothetical protein M3325_04600, partial [Actinomycetota bacterium]|nr:hypothetical protein [Actinomycetota bacterium]
WTGQWGIDQMVVRRHDGLARQRCDGPLRDQRWASVSDLKREAGCRAGGSAVWTGTTTVPAAQGTGSAGLGWR